MSNPARQWFGYTGHTRMCLCCREELTRDSMRHKNGQVYCPKQLVPVRYGCPRCSAQLAELHAKGCPIALVQGRAWPEYGRRVHERYCHALEEAAHVYVGTRCIESDSQPLPRTSRRTSLVASSEAILLASVSGREPRAGRRR